MPPHRKRVHHIDEASQAHELTFTCHRRMPLLSKDRSRHWFLQALAAARDKHVFTIWAYVIMPEHVHVLIFPEAVEYSTASILKSIKLAVSRKASNYLRRHNPDFLKRLAVKCADGKVEHRFWMPGPGYDRNVIEPDTALAVIDYIHANPVRRGLVKAAIDWPWSSARQYAGLDNIKLEVERFRG